MKTRTDIVIRGAGRQVLCACLLMLPLLGFTGERAVAQPASASAPALDALQASPVAVSVGVAEALRAPPFDLPRFLKVPPGYTIDVVARVPGARFLALAPDGALLVSQPGEGGITLLHPPDPKGSRPDGQPGAIPFASGLHHPHDMVFHRIGNVDYLYVAESNRITRSRYQSGANRIGTLETVVANLPDASSPELNGSYGHQLKNIALRGDKLYVSVASTCNVCVSDTQANPVRGAIIEYDAGGGNPRVFARGLRNAEGLRFRPDGKELWAVVNSRDNIPYPFHKDWDGDGKDDYGRVMQGYVDNHPPDLLTRVRDGGSYGWPFCNPNPDHGLDAMPYDRDVDLNPDGRALDCGAIDRVTKGIPAHSAPLGLNFLQDALLPVRYRDAMLVALHGCWNCSRLNGHKIVLYPMNPDGSVADGIDLVGGWVTDATRRRRWGRPVSALADGRGTIYITDDMAGAVYRLRHL